MSKLIRSKSYVFTADPQSAIDMQQIDLVKKSVKAMNDQMKEAHKYACLRAVHRNEPIPKAPKRYRVRLMGRGPRRVYANAMYGGRYNSSYDSYLPQRYAVRFDVYISEVR